MRMLADNILVDPEKSTERQIGSIHLPDNRTAKQAFARGIVIEIGPGCWLHNGERPPVEMIVGDRILYYHANAAPIVVDRKEMHIVREREVLAILDPDDVKSRVEGESSHASN